MVARELTRTRAEHRRRMVAKVQVKGIRAPQLNTGRHDSGPVRTYGNYLLPGTGHPAVRPYCESGHPRRPHLDQRGRSAHCHPTRTTAFTLHGTYNGSS